LMARASPVIPRIARETASASLIMVRTVAESGKGTNRYGGRFHPFEMVLFCEAQRAASFAHCE
jgi:hypothetical protein